jgi:hypothetical protein
MWIYDTTEAMDSNAKIEEEVYWFSLKVSFKPGFSQVLGR